MHATHEVKLKIYMTDGALEQMRKHLREHNEPESIWDVEMSAMALVAVGRGLHGVKPGDMEKAAAMASLLSNTASALMLTSIDLPFGTYQVATSPALGVAIVCGQNDPHAVIQQTVDGIKHIAECKEKIHGPHCGGQGLSIAPEGIASASMKPLNTADSTLKKMISMLGNMKSQETKVPETKNRIKKFDNPSNN